MSRRQIRILAQDVVRFFGAVVDQSAFTFASFEALWRLHNMEYLHFAGCTAVVPYHVHVVGHLLAFGAAYLSVPQSINEHAILFGVLWMYFVYFTQPGIDEPSMVVKIRLPVSAVQHAVALSAEVPLLAQVLGKLQQSQALYLLPFVDHSIYWQELVSAHETARCPLIPLAPLEDGHQTDLQIPAELEEELSAYSAALQKALPSP